MPENTEAALSTRPEVQLITIITDLNKDVRMIRGKHANTEGRLKAVEEKLELVHHELANIRAILKTSIKR